MRVAAGGHELVEDLDRILEKLASPFLAVALIMGLRPFASHALTQFRPLFPNLRGDCPEVHLQNSHALFRHNHHDVPMIGILQFDQVIDVGRTVQGNPVWQRNLKLQRQKERMLTRSREDGEPLGIGQQLRCQHVLDTSEGGVEVVLLLDVQALPKRPHALVERVSIGQTPSS